MTKSQIDMAVFLKSILPQAIPEDFPIGNQFIYGVNEKSVRKGISAFRHILISIFDRLSLDRSAQVDHGSKKEENDSHVSFASAYPFLNSLKSILFNIGIFSQVLPDHNYVMIESLGCLMHIVSAEGSRMKSTISPTKLRKALDVLTTTGFMFTDSAGEKLNGKEPSATPVIVSFPREPDLFIGMKALAFAQRRKYSSANHDIFLRCDFRALSDEPHDPVVKLEEYGSLLPSAVKSFLLNLHRQSANLGLSCTINVFYLHIRFIYSLSGKEIWTYSLSRNTGHRILINAENTECYSGEIHEFPPEIQRVIRRGYGCDKKLYGEPCQKGCHGFSFALHDSVLTYSGYLEAWLELEITARLGKGKKKHKTGDHFSQAYS